jgi:hypothetical protein
MKQEQVPDSMPKAVPAKKDIASASARAEKAKIQKAKLEQAEVPASSPHLFAVLIFMILRMPGTVDNSQIRDFQIRV